MRRMIWLHQEDEGVLVNPDHIEAVYKRKAGGSHVFFNGEDDPMDVNEGPEEIDRLISLG